jgi:eukaryotic-like serine/threonine-protein kinase
MKKLGKFEILEQIGRGAMGVVYKARDPFIGRLVALKTITTGLAEDPALLERFYQEARSAGALEHPNIVTIYELGKEGDTPFIAMAFLEGGSLDKLIEARPALPLSQKLGYIVYVCRALEYAHKRGVVHRDIKPGNVMVTADGTVKVVDFGIARLGDTGRTQTGTLIGTLGYMSPQLIGGKTADAKSDIWAAGVMFYELLTYQRPFNGENHYALMMNIHSQPTPPILEAAPGTPPDVVKIVERMLRKDVDERFQSMEEVLIELEPIWKRLQQAEVAALVADSKQLFEARDLGRAQDVLRKALLIDTANTQAKHLLEKVNADIRRREIVPQVKIRVEKGENLLAAGQFEEAKVEAEAALHLDSTFLPARELLAQVQSAAERARVLAQGLRTTKQRLAEGAITEAELQLTKVLAIDAANVAAQDLLKQIREEKSRREYQKRLSETLHHARAFWTELRYDECIQLLLDAQQKYPGEGEIDKLLETARQEKAEQERQTLLTQARSFLRAQQFDEALKVLERVLAHSPADSTAKNLRMLALQGREQQTRERQLKGDLATLRALVKDGKYQEAIARGEELLRVSPKEFELGELVAYARSEHIQREQKRKLEQWIEKVNQGIKSGRFRDAIQAAKSGLDEFPRDSGLMLLLEHAKKQEQEKEKQEVLDQRIKEVEAKMNREELTEAIDLAKQTLVEYGPDTGISQLLRKAEVKREEQERKRRHAQQEVIQSTRTMVDVGNFGAATMILQNALEAQLFSESDPRLVEMRHEIDEKQTTRPTAAPASVSGAVTPPSGGAPWGDPNGDPGKDYVDQRSASTRDVPVAPSSDAAASAIFSTTSVTGPAILSFPPPAAPKELKGPPGPGKSTKRDMTPTAPNEFSATRVIQSVTNLPAASSQATEIISQLEIVPIRHLPSSTPSHATVPGRKRAVPAALYVLSGVLVVGVGAYLFSMRDVSAPGTNVQTDTPAPSGPWPNLVSGPNQPTSGLPDTTSANLEKTAGQPLNTGTNGPGQTSSRPEPKPTGGPGGLSQVTIPASPGGNTVAKDNATPAIVDRPSQPPVNNPQTATPPPSQPGPAGATESETRVTPAAPSASPAPAPKTESTTVAANLTPAKPVPPPVVPVSTDATRIRQLLNAYAQAYARRDRIDLRTVWPTMTDKQFNDYQGNFKSVDSIRLTLEPCASPEINGDSASIACTQNALITGRGAPQQTLVNAATFYLRKSENAAAGWIIDRIEYKKASR